MSELATIGSDIFDRLPDVFTKQIPDDNFQYIQIIGREHNQRTYRWVKKSYVSAPDNLDSYKLFIPAANGRGDFGETLSTPIIGKPNEGHTQTFISIGTFADEQMALNALNYIKGKFARAMLGVLKVTQNNNREAWGMIPIQDFSPNSDIDWSKSVKEIDKQLYKKYGLDEKEIEFIETHVKEME